MYGNQFLFDESIAVADNSVLGFITRTKSKDPNVNDEKMANNPNDSGAWGPTGPLAAMLIAMVIFGATLSGNISSDYATRAGYAFGQAAVFWLLYSLVIKAFTKGREPFRSLAFVGIWIALFVGSFFDTGAASGITKHTEEKNSAVAINEINKTYENFLEQSEDAQGPPKRVENLENTAPVAQGDAGELERFVKQMIAEFGQARNDYLLELNTLGWEQILSAQRLARDKGLAQSKLTIKRARDIAYKYKTKNDVLMEKARGDILRLNISENIRNEMAAGFDRGLQKSKLRSEKLWGMEIEVVEEFDAMITLLAQYPSAWVVEGDQIYFDNDFILNQYNRHLETINQIIKQQEEIHRQNADDWRNTMSGLAYR